MSQVTQTPVTEQDDAVLSVIDTKQMLFIECALCCEPFEVEDGDSFGPELLRREIAAQGWVKYNTDSEEGYAHGACVADLAAEE